MTQAGRATPSTIASSVRGRVKMDEQVPSIGKSQKLFFKKCQQDDHQRKKPAFAECENKQFGKIVDCLKDCHDDTDDAPRLFRYGTPLPSVRNPAPVLDPGFEFAAAVTEAPAASVFALLVLSFAAAGHPSLA